MNKAEQIKTETKIFILGIIVGFMAAAYIGIALMLVTR